MVQGLEAFEGRLDALRRVTRYSMYSPMLYRTNLVTHSKHVAWLMQEIAPFAKAAFGDAFDADRAVVLAAVHDDHEIVMGDVQFGNKQMMTKEQTAALHQQEVEAINQTAAKFPEFVGPYRYRDLLMEAYETQTLESQVLKYLDKFEAFGEALHEVHAGNAAFTVNVVTEYGRSKTPFESYIPWFANYTKMYPRMQPLTESAFPLFGPIAPIDFADVAKRSRPHTLQSLLEPSGYAPYDAWRTIIVKYASEEEIRDLLIQTEFTR
jgi:5'-deoxynucleotidase YfbR-like HD superfamily hydrolase